MRTLALLLVTAATARADDWPCWRGPARNGISSEKGWKDRWPEAGPPVLWTAEVGTGFSSFSVAGGNAYTLGNGDHKDTLFCLDAGTGEVRWKHTYPSELGAKFYEGGPGSTPVVDGDRVYSLGKWGDLFCLEAGSGRVVWSRNIREEFEAPPPTWGFSGSPVVHEDLLLLNAGEAGLALEKGTGRKVWMSEASESGYSTPLPVRLGGSWAVLLASAKHYLAVEPRTGRELWRYRWLTQYNCNAADPVVSDGRVFVSSGYGKGAAVVKLEDGEQVWRSKTMRNQVHSPVLLAGSVYGIDGNMGPKARLKCVDFATGEERWTLDDVEAGALAAADGRLLFLTAGGELSVASASPEGFRPTARAKILEGKCWTAPVLANGRILARNAAGRVVCVDVRGER